MKHNIQKHIFQFSYFHLILSVYMKNKEIGILSKIFILNLFKNF